MITSFVMARITHDQRDADQCFRVYAQAQWFNHTSQTCAILLNDLSFDDRLISLVRDGLRREATCVGAMRLAYIAGPLMKAATPEVRRLSLRPAVDPYEAHMAFLLVAPDDEVAAFLQIAPDEPRGLDAETVAEWLQALEPSKDRKKGQKPLTRPK